MQIFRLVFNTPKARSDFNDYMRGLPIVRIIWEVYWAESMNGYGFEISVYDEDASAVQIFIENYFPQNTQ
jgi:hypothetical protein